MTLTELKSFYLNGNRFEKETGIGHASWHNWFKKYGYIPIKAQFKIESLTKGKLKADIKHTKREVMIDAEEREIRRYLIDALMARLTRELTPDLIKEIVEDITSNMGHMIKEGI